MKDAGSSVLRPAFGGRVPQFFVGDSLEAAQRDLIAELERHRDALIKDLDTHLELVTVLTSTIGHKDCAIASAEEAMGYLQKRLELQAAEIRRLKARLTNFDEGLDVA